MLLHIPSMDLSKLIEPTCKLARDAGREILNIYAEPVEFETKDDDSPLTRADMASHHWIVDALTSQFSDIPVLSEESAEIPFDQRKEWTRFWLVDPLDGTKEFIKKTGEFTVNIALIDQGEPVLGVVYAPAIDLLYSAAKGLEAIKQPHSGERIRMSVRTPDPACLSIVASRDHAGPMVKALLERFPDASTRSMGSSLKFCLVAEGEADVYLRDVPTMEWDTAAAQCILECAGGSLTDLEGNRLCYNKESVKNPAIISLGDPQFDWKSKP